MPTALVYLCRFPLFPVFTTQGRPFGVFDGAAAAVTLVAICIEAAADQQLRRFAQTNEAPGHILDTGLWAYSRHPNYFEEVLFWWGLFLLGIAADPSRWWTIAGAVSITLLFIFISLPLIEKRMSKKTGYAEHVQRISGLVPWFRIK